MEIIITNSKIEKAIKNKGPKLINPNNIKSAITTLHQNKKEPLSIYDITYNTQYENNYIFEVSDHINKTGHNPLIGNQHKFSEQFVDVADLYSSSTGIITTSLGPYFSKQKHQHPYPSEYLCYISIIARAIGHIKINAYLVNVI